MGLHWEKASLHWVARDRSLRCTGSVGEEVRAALGRQGKKAGTEASDPSNAKPTFFCWSLVPDNPQKTLVALLPDVP